MNEDQQLGELKRRGKHGLLNALFILELSAAMAFVWAVWNADQAMDKSGLGDYARFAYWNNWAGVFWYVFIGLWLVGITAAGFREGGRFWRWPIRSRVGLFVIGPPLALLFGMVVSLLSL
jgi:hypothetical protein